MKRSSSFSMRLYTLLLILACLWTMCGAPLTPQQWQALPLTLRRLAVQAPGRMRMILRFWPVSGISSISHAQAESPYFPLTVWDADAQALLTMSAEEYVQRVVAAEMPAEYHLEALKAQAVAARTRAAWACRSLGGNGCASHPEADLCTSASCCQGYLDEAAQRDRWGGQHDAYSTRISAAVNATQGQILTYEGMPLQMLYHACSGGMTEDASAVFAQSLPYLKSVESPGEEHSSAFSATATFSLTEVCRILEEAFPGCGISPDGLAGQLRLQSTTASGRVGSLLVGTKTVSGRDFREALGLHSTLFTWDFTGESVAFHTLGYGHGVGMSQAGAQAMAADGVRYAAILAHYYPGSCLSAMR